MPQEWSNRLRRKRWIVQQVVASAQPSLGNDALQLFVESAGPSETPQERINRLRQERQTVQQAVTRAQPSYSNDALQLFRDEDASAPTWWDYGEIDIICGFYNAKMWIKKQLAKSSNNNPQFYECCKNGKILLPNLLITLQELKVLLTNKERNAVKFRDQICMYNSVLAFTSLGAKIDGSVTRGIGLYSFRI
jgi:hypothetical protein